ncbi:MAG: type II toxin-antitoxin system HicA family toxin [Gemmataceae bacterium]
MKARDLLSALEAAGCIRLRESPRHVWFRHPTTGRTQPVPVRRFVSDELARQIQCRLLGFDRLYGEPERPKKPRPTQDESLS